LLVAGLFWEKSTVGWWLSWRCIFLSTYINVTRTCIIIYSKYVPSPLLMRPDNSFEKQDFCSVLVWVS
jgi:hypothetical protein